jgi:hypothetical protein
LISSVNGGDTAAAFVKMKGAPQGAPSHSVLIAIKALISWGPISKMWIRVHGKARFGEKAQHTR